jgi:hypothetical protein
MLRDGLQATASGDSELAIACLARLADVSGQPGPVAHLVAAERNRMALARVNAALADGNVGAAHDILEQRVRERSGDDVLRQDLRIVTALLVLDGYVDRQPYRNADAAMAALHSVRKQGDVLQASAAFRDWFPAEEARLAERKRREIEARIGALLEQCDRAISRADPGAVLILDEVAGLAPESTVAGVIRAFDAGDADVSRLLADSSPGDAAGQKGLELLAAWHWGRLGPATRSRVADAVAGFPARSAAGRRLRIEIAAEGGNRREAIRLAWEWAAEAEAVPAAFAERLLPRLLLPRAQFGARPWRTPVPGIGDLLGRIAQLREDRQSGTPAE